MLNNETIYELTQGIEFMGYEHMIFYCENVIKTKSERDVYRKAFFYTLGILVTTRTNIDSLYDFQSNCPNVRRVRAKVANRIYSQIMSIGNKSIQWFLSKMVTYMGQIQPQPDTDGKYTPYRTILNAVYEIYG